MSTTKKNRLAPGVSHSVYPEGWDVQGLRREEVLIAAMQWKLELLNKVRLPKRKTAHRFFLNILKTA